MSKNMIWEEPQLFDTGQPEKPQKQAVGADSVPASVIDAVWQHYVSTMSARGPQPKLTESRSRLIRNRIAEHGADMCKAAISGCANSEWHMGGNPQGKKYNSIELILRNAEKVEWFSELDTGMAEGDPF